MDGAREGGGGGKKANGAAGGGAAEDVDMIAIVVRFGGRGVWVLDTGVGAGGKSNGEDWRTLGETA